MNFRLILPNLTTNSLEVSVGSRGTRLHEVKDDCTQLGVLKKTSHLEIVRTDPVSVSNRLQMRGL